MSSIVQLSDAGFLVPPVFPTAGVPQRREARIGAGGFRSATFATFDRSGERTTQGGVPGVPPRWFCSGGTPAARSSYWGEGRSCGTGGDLAFF